MKTGKCVHHRRFRFWVGLIMTMLLCGESCATGALAAGLIDNGFTMSGSLSYTLVDAADQTFVNTGYYDATRALGIAGNFHIVAFDTATLNTHTNGNLLANTVVASSNFGTNGIADEVSYIQHYTQVSSTSGSSTDHTLALGSSETVALEDSGTAFSVNGVKLGKPWHIAQDADTGTLPFVNMATVRSQIQSGSALIGGYGDAGVTTSFADENNRAITLTDPDGLGVYNTTATAMNGYSNRPMNLRGFSQGHTGTILINIDCSGVAAFTMPDLKMFFLDGTEARTDEKTSFTEGRVLLNFIHCDGTDIEMKITKASMLALNANVTLSQNFNGTVVAENVTVNAESHRDDYLGLRAAESDPGDPGDPNDPGDPAITDPDSGTPQTGDASTPILWVVLMSASTGGYAVSYLGGKKNARRHRRP